MRIPATPPHHRRGEEADMDGAVRADGESTEYRRPLYTSRREPLPRSSTIPLRHRLPPPLTIHRHPGPFPLADYRHLHHSTVTTTAVRSSYIRPTSYGTILIYRFTFFYIVPAAVVVVVSAAAFQIYLRTHARTHARRSASCARTITTKDRPTIYSLITYFNFNNMPRNPR